MNRVAVLIAGSALLMGGLVGFLDLRAGRDADLTEPVKTTKHEKAPPGLFEDITRRAGIVLPPTPTWGATWFDGDRDGFPDLLLGRHKRHARLFLNDGGRFSVGDQPALSTPAPGRKVYDRHNCAWGTGNDEGPALYCVSGARNGVAEGPNQFLTLDEDGLLRDSASEMGLLDPLGRGRSVNWLDFDGDGRLDLFVGNEIRTGVPNRLFKNLGGAFVAVDVGLGSELPTLSSAWSDWDRDGFPDLIVTGHGYLGTRVFKNQGGSFVDAEIPGVTWETWKSASFGDIDGDGWPDLALARDDRLEILLNQEGVFGEPFSMDLIAGRMAAWGDLDNDGMLDLVVVQGAVGDPPSPGAENHPNFILMNDEGELKRMDHPLLGGQRKGDGESVSLVDVDGDGLLDLFVTNGHLDVRGRVRLLRNTFPEAGGSATVILQGDAGNPFGFGATVRLRSDSHDYWREVTDGVVFRTQTPPGVVHLGLGDDAGASVDIVWPDGAKDCVTIRAGGRTEVVKGSSGCG